MTAVLRRFDLTEGQTYTAAIGLALAIVLAVAGIPAVLHSRPLSAASTLNALNPRGAQTTGSTAANPPTTPNPNDAPPTRTAFAPVPGTSATPAAPLPLPPGVTASPASGAVALTITTFATVGHPGAPGGVAVGPNGTIYVPTDNGSARGDPGASHVFAYDAQGQPTGDLTITGQSSGHAHGLTSAAVDPKTGAIAVLEPDDARIVTVDVAAGTQRALTTVPDLPACLISLGANPCQQGTEDRRPFPTAVAYDPHGDLFIADPMQDTIWRLHPNEQVPEVWYQSTSFALGDGPFGLASSSGTIAFTVGSTIEPSAPGGGGLYRLVVNLDGTAGALTLVAAFARGVEPGAVAVGSSGTAYVILRSTGALVAIAPAGTETFRITPPGQGPIPLDAPSGLALVAGHVLVANEGSGTDASRWALLSIAVNDGVAQ